MMLQASIEYPLTYVVDDPSCNSLGIVRALGRQGVKVHLLTCLQHSWAQESRYVERIHRLPCKYGDSEEIRKYLTQLADGSPDKPVLVPTGDEILISLIKNINHLDQHYQIMCPPASATEILVNKKVFYQTMSEIGVPVPKTYNPCSSEEMDEVAELLNYSVVVKPNRSYEFWQLYGRKNYVIHNRDQYLKVKTVLNPSVTSLLFQEYLNSEDIYLVYIAMDKTGEPLTLCGYDKLRLHAGNGSYCSSKRRDDLIEIGVSALRAIGFHGVAEPEFIRDPRDGEYKMIEINARSTTQNRLPAACGADVDFTYYQYLLGKNAGVANVDFKENIKWISEHEDLATVLQSRNLNIGEWMKALIDARAYATLAKDDLRPSFLTLKLILKVFGAYLLGRLAKNG